MKKIMKILFPLLIVLALTLAACAPTPALADKASGQPGNSTEFPIQQATLPASPTADILPTQPAATPILPETSDLAREDGQGSVVVVVTPLNLDSISETLEFDVSMNTHSVDLSMDLAVLATLTTDSGIKATPTSWTGQLGGHHVEGTLSFPASVDGKPILDGATTLTITLINIDAPERIFTWQLTKK